MRKGILSISLLITVLLTFSAFCSAANKNNQSHEEVVLAAAENVFIVMKNKEYTAIWNILSTKSKQVIVEDVYSAVKKAGEKYNKEEILNDFISGGLLSKEFWDSFLTEFDPKMVLDDCKWVMGKIEEKESEIYLQYKKSENVTVLKMYKEDSLWKFGWYETFGARRLNPF
jgi:hypothetical protein